ncbi:hypothetical protein AAFF_G00025040 [Aldrovandia affinis]|uniref:Ig-like domain-containing protein n=1 Tax=Aldrovandia affinis TaxID=143900 RepID=A0AAD7T7F6_9TELE|nr:hypothetical protein AAFF_G00025040 [Aldrovandia affinis]
MESQQPENTVRRRPRFDQDARNVVKQATCPEVVRAVGGLPITYSWSSGVHKTLISTSPQMHIDYGGALHISKVQWSDRGEYHCTAENIVGRDQRTTTLTVFAEADPGGFTAGDREEDSRVTNSRTEQRISHHWNNGPSNLQNMERIEATSKDLGIHIQISGITLPPAVMHGWVVADSSVPGSMTLALQASLGKGSSAPPTVESLPPVMQSELSLFPSLSTKWTSSVLHHGLQSFEGLVFETDRLAALSPDSQSLPTGPHSQLPGHDSPAQSLPLADRGWLPNSGPRKQNGSQVTGSTESGEIRRSEWPKRNSSQHPMRKSSGTTRIKPQSTSWLPVLEKHDIPIVVGVGVSLAFIFITMAFYSLVQKNEPAPTGRAAHRNLGIPHRRTGRPETRTYENRAFEDDNMVAVIEQSPNTRTQAPPSALSTVTMVTESPKTLAVQSQHPQDQTAIAETHPEPNKEPQDVDDWGGGESGQCQDAYNAPPSSPLACREEGIHTFLMLQTTESSTTPVHHRVSMSHDSAPLLVSHSVSIGVTTVAVDVHFYPAASPFTPTAPGPRDTFQLAQESDQTAPKVHNAPRMCL